jgi:uncharacterized protein YndB with AHSA1/START domain
MSYDLRVERLLDGTPDEVFDAFTDEEAMLEWYQDNPGWQVEVLACDTSVGGSTIVWFGPGAGQRYVEEMTYTEVDRPGRLAYSEIFRMPDGSNFETAITITFEAQDGKTLMTIVQTGFPNAEERDGHQAGWPGFIDRLERVVAKRRAA